MNMFVWYAQGTSGEGVSGRKGWNFIYCTGIRHVAIQLHSFAADSVRVNAPSAQNILETIRESARGRKSEETRVKSIDVVIAYKNL